MSKLKYIVKGIITGIPVGSVIEVEEAEVEKQNLATILELAPEGAEVTDFDAPETAPEPEPEPEKKTPEPAKKPEPDPAPKPAGGPPIPGTATPAVPQPTK